MKTMKCKHTSYDGKVYLWGTPDDESADNVVTFDYISTWKQDTLDFLTAGSHFGDLVAFVDFLGQQDGLDVGQNASLSDGHTGKHFV